MWPTAPTAPTRYATDNPCVIHRSRGGSAANVAAFASAWVPTRFIGCVGLDPAADVLTSELAGHGVDVRVQRRGRTGTIVVLIDGKGERTMYPDRAAAAQLADVPAAWLESAAMLHAPSSASRRSRPRPPCWGSFSMRTRPASRSRLTPRPRP